jgi:hypothetical protein
MRAVHAKAGPHLPRWLHRIFPLVGANLSLRAINLGFPLLLCTPAPTPINHDKSVTSNETSALTLEIIMSGLVKT